MRHRLAAAFAATISCIIAIGAEASEPSLTTATYDDWTVRCSVLRQGEEQTESGEGGIKVCELLQTARVKESGRVILETAMGRVGENEPFRIVFKVPLSVLLREPILLTIDDTALISASYLRCVKGSCIAETELTPDEIGMVVSASTLLVEFKNSPEQPIKVPVNTSGLAAAYRHAYGAF